MVDGESDDDYDPVPDVALRVAVTDDDAAAIVVTAAENFGVTEGSTATYTVKLATKPGSDVVVQLSITAGSGVTVDTDDQMTGDQDRLTFTTSDWSTAQTVTVAAAHDDDGDAGSATVTHAVADAESDEDYDEVPDVSLNVAVTDDDTPAIVVTAAENFTVNEGSTATYTVELATKPGGDVVVQLSVAGSGVTVDTDGVMTGAQDRLTFTAADWSTAQTVTVAAAQDDDGDPGSATITHTVVDAESDDDYDPVLDVALAVAVTDDDVAAIVVEAAENFGVAEGSTATYTVKLATEPGGDVVVRLSVAGAGVSVDTDGVMTGNQDRLTFTTTDWSTAQSVTVSAAEDDDGDAGSATITHAVVDAESDEDYDPAPDVDLAVAVSDDDIPAIVVTAVENFTVVEGATAIYMVELATQPGSDVVVQLSVAGAGVTVDTDDQMIGDQTQLTFTTTDWSTAQSVTVGAAHDDDGDAGSATITHAVVDGESDDDYDPVPDVALRVAVTDDDAAAIVVTAVENFGVTEGSTASYSVRLATKPGSDVVIQLTVAGAGVTVDTDSGTAGDQSKLTFTSTDWNTAQTVTVAAAHDDDGDAGSATVTHAVVDGESDEDYDDVSDVTLAVAVSDDDAAAIVVTAAENFGVIEGGTATYTVELATKPASDVVIQLSTTAGSGVTVDTDDQTPNSQSKLTFTTSNWSTAQTVTVAAAHDDDGDPGPATITHAVVDADSDEDYDSVPDVDLVVAVTDDDTAAIVVTAAENFGVTEGSTANYTVKLATKPGGDVVVQLSVTAGSGVTVDTDGVMPGDQSKLTFTTTDWSTAQTVTVTAGQDDDGDPGSATITHAVVDADSDEDYDDVSDVTLAVAVSDDDTAAIVVTAAENFGVTEGSTATYTVRLATKPGSDVVVQLSVAGSGVTVDTDTSTTGDQDKLTFTTSDWSTAQTVTVAAAEDDDGDPGSATITHAVVDGESDDDYDPVPDVALAVSVTDDDIPAIVVTAAANFTVAEGSTATYTVKLATEPGSDVVVRLSVAGAGVTVDTDGGTAGDQDRLTFTASDWSTAQTVTVAAAHDDDGDAGSATITHAVVDGESDEDYDPAPDVALPVAVTDNDTAAIVIAPMRLTVPEGGTGTYTVKLATRPTSSVTVDITLPAGGNLTVEPEPNGPGGSPGVDGDPVSGARSVSGAGSGSQDLRFATDTWSTEQRVTVRAAHDEDTVDGTTTIIHMISATGTVNDYDMVSAQLIVTVTDDDRAAIITPGQLTVPEGGTGTYTVKLAAEPTGDVTVDITLPANSDVTVDTDPNTDGVQTTPLTFTTANWGVTQTITVLAAHDDDSTDDTVQVTHTVDDDQSPDDYDGAADVSLTVTVADDDDDEGGTAGPSPVAVIRARAEEVVEGEEAEFVLDVDPAPEGAIDISVAVSTTNGAATAGTHTVAIAADGVTGSFTIPTNDDLWMAPTARSRPPFSLGPGTWSAWPVRPA